MLDGKERTDVSQSRMNRLFSAYIGEAILERAESGIAKWELNPVEDDPSFGTPVVIDWAKDDGMAISPVERRELLIANREPFLKELVNYCENKEKIEEAFFDEFD